MEIFDDFTQAQATLKKRTDDHIAVPILRVVVFDPRTEKNAVKKAYRDVPENVMKGWYMFLNKKRTRGQVHDEIDLPNRLDRTRVDELKKIGYFPKKLEI